METRRRLFGRIKDAFVPIASREPSFCLVCERLSDECECERSKGVSRRFFLMSAAATVAAVSVPIPETTWFSVSPTPNIIGISTPLGETPLGDWLISPEWIAKEAMKLFENNLTVASRVNRSYDQLFVDEYGPAVVTIRKTRQSQ